jgi:hypothetical protein
MSTQSSFYDPNYDVWADFNPAVLTPAGKPSSSTTVVTNYPGSDSVPVAGGTSTTVFTNYTGSDVGPVGGAVAGIMFLPIIVIGGLVFTTIYLATRR